jgi:hypothetical protein
MIGSSGTAGNPPDREPPAWSHRVMRQLILKCQGFAVAVLMMGAIERAGADEFERLEGPALAGVARAESSRRHESLSVAELGNLPRVLAGVRNGLVVVRTDDGNLARVLALPALRAPRVDPNAPGMKKGDADAPAIEPRPMLLLERFDTFEAGAARTRLAHGRDLSLFDGFEFDLDTGQVVPPGFGGDVRFEARDGGGRLVALQGVTMWTLTESPLPPSSTKIAPTDAAGRFHLFANAQWSGLLDLEVGDQGAITGRFRSDQTGVSYRVTGEVAADRPERLRFDIQFPRSRQEYDALLFTEGRGGMAGTVRLLDRDFGFFAVREGGRFAPADAGVATLEDLDAPGRIDLELIAPDRFRGGDGREMDAAAATAFVRGASDGEADAWVRLTVAAEVSFGAASKELARLRQECLLPVRAHPTTGP